MKYVFSSTNMNSDQDFVEGLLSEAGIPYMIRHEHLAMALGELAPSDWSPGFLMTRTSQS